MDRSRSFGLYSDSFGAAMRYLWSVLSAKVVFFGVRSVLYWTRSAATTFMRPIFWSCRPQCVRREAGRFFLFVGFMSFGVVLLLELVEVGMP